MTAMSAAPTAASGFTPPSSSHGSGSSNVNGNGYAWNGSYSTAENDENSMHYRKTANHYDATNGHQRSPLISQNGYSPSDSPVAPTPKDSDSNLTGMAAAAYVSPPYSSSAVKSPSTKDSATVSSDSLPDTYRNSRGTKRLTGEVSPTGSFGGLPDDSKWIHRDKLARIESEELQAAGIFLPAPRSHSRPRHATQERPSATRKTSDADLHGSSRPRKNSSAVAGSTGSGDPRPQGGAANWDLRLPEEIAEAEEANYWTSVNGMKGSSRIPVAKVSPVPIPSDVLERDVPARRRRDSSPNDEGADIKMPRTRARSSSASTKLEAAANTAVGSTPQPKRTATDSSPKKATNGSPPRKAASVRKGSGKSGTGRQKTRGAPSKDSTSSASGTTRPSTRSGDRELSTASPVNNTRAPEGDPPWMVSAYKPDPRLPPDQQLLPTVAKRLQQEKWEREGKFGNIYDREFRPLTDEGFLSPPDPKDKANPEPTEKPEEKAEDWPLKAEPKSPTAPSLRQQRTGSYSTIPKVQDPPQSPVPPSRGNGAPGQPSPLIRVPDVPDDDARKEKKGCMCCIVM
ncbi:hypothetical protein MAPG_00086 [Magnaporthiopsis poae ATCC 64411]|uniref:TeaA receptor TeaR n=1 Tax=Magnaporthiopsis poae (strain ATCC 64411 / 73-15) TaxID=644358 RepID=A0A0C4DK23_MAGP6|nr:hypothetical protein MAPG_00086 [Magnaporthiopsis poae ATCC 64411]